MSGRKRGEYTQSGRVLRILDRLRGRRNGVLLRELAAEFGVDPTQIKRDLLILEDGGYPNFIEQREVEGPSGKERRAPFVRLRERVGLQSVPLTREERYSLLAVRCIFDVFDGTPFYKDVSTLCDKLLERMPKQDQDELTTWGQRFLFVPDGGRKDYSASGRLLDRLRTAVLHRRVVRYVYSQASGKAQRGLLAPYAIVLYRQGFYVVGRRLSLIRAARN